MNMPPDSIPALLPISAVIKLAGLSKSHLYALVRRGQFPQAALRIGPRFTRWRAADVAEYLNDPQAWLAAHAAVSTLASEVSA